MRETPLRTARPIRWVPPARHKTMKYRANHTQIQGPSQVMGLYQTPSPMRFAPLLRYDLTLLVWGNLGVVVRGLGFGLISPPVQQRPLGGLVVGRALVKPQIQQILIGPPDQGTGFDTQNVHDLFTVEVGPN